MSLVRKRHRGYDQLLMQVPFTPGLAVPSWQKTVVLRERPSVRLFHETANVIEEANRRHSAVIKLAKPDGASRLATDVWSCSSHLVLADSFGTLSQGQV